MRDLEGNELIICKGDNEHLVVTGQSGKGKTYAVCRQIESAVEEGKSVLILDFSGSYSETELRKHNFKYMEKVEQSDVSAKEFCWNVRILNEKAVRDSICDAILEVLSCGSYFQKKLLRESVYSQWVQQERITIGSVIHELEIKLTKELINETVRGNVENLGRLLTRLAPYESLENFVINQEKEFKKVAPISIVDISRFPLDQRKFLVKIMISLFWSEAVYDKEQKHADCLVLDEVQLLSFQAGTSLEGMMREGRKKDLSMILSTQFVSCYSPDELFIIEQSANFLIFRPNPSDVKVMQKYLGTLDKTYWTKRMQELKRGEAIYKGGISINGRTFETLVNVLI